MGFAPIASMSPIPTLIQFSPEELDAIREQCLTLASSALSATFDFEEMKAIREQYEERLAAEEARREDAEWRLSIALAHLRDAETHLAAVRANLRSDAPRPRVGTVRVEAVRPARLAEGTQPRARMPVAQPAPRQPQPPLPTRAAHQIKVPTLPQLPSPPDLGSLRDALLSVSRHRLGSAIPAKN